MLPAAARVRNYFAGTLLILSVTLDVQYSIQKETYDMNLRIPSIIQLSLKALAHPPWQQVDVSAAGSLRRHDFSLALDRAGMSLSVEDTDNLFRSLTSANRGRGCDIEMFAHLVNFWAR